jgi:hypothetical protein
LEHSPKKVQKVPPQPPLFSPPRVFASPGAARVSIWLFGRFSGAAYGPLIAKCIEFIAFGGSLGSHWPHGEVENGAFRVETESNIYIYVYS